MVASSSFLNHEVSLCFSSMIRLLNSLVPSLNVFLIANAFVFVLYSFTKLALFGSDTAREGESKEIEGLLDTSILIMDRYWQQLN